jgi:hypothetical protein
MLCDSWPTSIQANSPTVVKARDGQVWYVYQYTSSCASLQSCHEDDHYFVSVPDLTFCDQTNLVHRCSFATFQPPLIADLSADHDSNNNVSSSSSSGCLIGQRGECISCTSKAVAIEVHACMGGGAGPTRIRECAKDRCPQPKSCGQTNVSAFTGKCDSWPTFIQAMPPRSFSFFT